MEHSARALPSSVSSQGLYDAGSLNSACGQPVQAAVCTRVLSLGLGNPLLPFVVLLSLAFCSCGCFSAARSLTHELHVGVSKNQGPS